MSQAFNITWPSVPFGSKQGGNSTASLEPWTTGCHNLNFTLAEEFLMHLAQLCLFSSAMY